MIFFFLNPQLWDKKSWKVDGGQALTGQCTKSDPLSLRSWQQLQNWEGRKEEGKLNSVRAVWDVTRNLMSLSLLQVTTIAAIWVQN